MALTYTWRIASMKVTNQDDIVNAVCNVFWEKVGTDENGVEGFFAGATPFNSFDPDNFTPFNELTEEQVLEWVKPLVVGDYEEHVNEQIQRDYEENINLRRQKPLPWGGGEIPASNTAPDVSESTDPAVPE